MKVPNINRFFCYSKHSHTLYLLVNNNGMVLIITHHDYINFGVNDNVMEEYSYKFYSQLLDYITEKYAGEFWHVLPREMARYWSKNFSDTEPS